MFFIIYRYTSSVHTSPALSSHLLYHSSINNQTLYILSYYENINLQYNNVHVPNLYIYLQKETISK